MSSSDTWSPLASETVHSSSSATTDEFEIFVSDSWKSSTDVPSASAISWSVGARRSLCSSDAFVFSIWRARARTERGTQSSERSSSMIEPLMRAIANVSNLMSREVSKRSIAEIRPSRPYEMRSESSTCAGRPLDMRPATYLTSGEYARTSRSRARSSPSSL